MLVEVYTNRSAYSNEPFVGYSRAILLDPLFVKDGVFLGGRLMLEV